jgi:taurine dioxygenase
MLSTTQTDVPSAPATAITVLPSPGPFGAEVTGIDIANGLRERDLQRVRDALLRYSVIVLRDQHLSPDDQLAFMDRLYALRPHHGHPSPFSLPGKPQIQVISNIVENGKPVGISDAGLLWHSDTCYFSNPEIFVSLYALEIPFRNGMALGDTQWTNTVSAYEALPEAIKTELRERRVCQSYTFHIEKMRSRRVLTRPQEAQKTEIVPQLHPVVRTHPITGRKLLYVNESFSERIECLSSERSQTLLHELWAHLAQPRFIFRHSWKNGDFVVWDNCATQHLATFDYGTIPRRLHRCGSDGPVPE